MKRSLSLMVTIAALALAGSAYATAPGDQGATGQPYPESQPSTVPSTEEPSAITRQSEPSSPQAQTDPSTAQSSISASQNTRLAAIVPAGMSTQEACSGFKSTAECAATLHASQNLGLSFSELKSKVTGGQKLSAAIKDLKPDANVRAEVRKAEQQAREDIQGPQG